MKAKAVTTDTAPAALKVALDQLRPRLESDVVGVCFGIPAAKMGPAEFYVQKTDEADGGTHDPFIHFTLSGVTWKECRDFDGALKKIEAILLELANQHFKSGQAVQIFVVIFTSKEDGSASKMYESNPLSHTIPG